MTIPPLFSFSTTSLCTAPGARAFSCRARISRGPQKAPSAKRCRKRSRHCAGIPKSNYGANRSRISAARSRSPPISHHSLNRRRLLAYAQPRFVSSSHRCSRYIAFRVRKAGKKRVRRNRRRLAARARALSRLPDARAVPIYNSRLGSSLACCMLREFSRELLFLSCSLPARF